MEITPIKLPEYFKNGTDFISIPLPINTKNDEYQFYSVDNEMSYYENLKTQPEDWHYRTKKVVYKLNSMGYRTKEFNDIDWKNSIVVLGCSCVFGTGVSEDETLSYYLSKLFNKDVINLGVSGSSNQFMLDTSIMLKKKYGIPFGIIMLWTSSARFPFYGFERLVHVGPWVYNDEDTFDFFKSKKRTTPLSRYGEMFDLMYTEKSHEIITMHNIVESGRNIWMDRTLYYDGSHFPETASYLNIDFFPSNRLARDLLHPGREVNELTANKIYRSMIK